MDSTVENKPTVPPQEEGSEKNIVYNIEAADENDAKKLFIAARNRLMDVNKWKELAGIASAFFTLCDSSGRALSRTVERGDFFKIELPAPGTTEGNGADWVRVEQIEQSGHSDNDHEFFSIRVRPAHNPEASSNEIAHFFTDESTSSFVLERKGKKLEAAVLGRNEKVNVETSNLIDKVRNAVVGTTALLGFSNVQWKNLLKGILKAD